VVSLAALVASLLRISHVFDAMHGIAL